MKYNHTLAMIHNATLCKVIITMANKQCMMQQHCSCIDSSNQPFRHIFSLKGIWHAREVEVNAELPKNDASGART